MECRWVRRYFWQCGMREGCGPATGPTLKTALCHICTLDEAEDKYSVIFCFYTDLVWCVLAASSSLKGLSPQALTLLEGVSLITRCLKRPSLREPDRAQGIFGAAGGFWATAQHLDPP